MKTQTICSFPVTEHLLELLYDNWGPDKMDALYTATVDAFGKRAKPFDSWLVNPDQVDVARTIIEKFELPVKILGVCKFCHVVEFEIPANWEDVYPRKPIPVNPFKEYIIDTPYFKVKTSEKGEVYKVNEYTLRNMQLAVAEGKLHQFFYLDTNDNLDVVRKDGILPGYPKSDQYTSIYKEESAMSITAELALRLISLSSK